MSTLRWLGRAPVVRQVDTIEITADDAATTYSVTIGGITVEVAGSGSSVGQTASDLKDALEASTHPYFTSLTYTLNSATITITGDNQGAPFSITAADTGGTGTLSHAAEATAAQSPNHWNAAENWSGGAVPTSNDEVIFDKGAVPLLWELDQNTLSLDLLRTDRSYTGWIGLNPWGFLDAGVENTSCPEYRDTHLHADFDRIEVGRESGAGTGAGQGRINLENGDTGTPVMQVFNTAGAPKDAGQLAVDYIPADAQGNLIVNNAPGGVGVCARQPGTTGTIGDINVATTNPASRVVVGEGVTWTNYRQNQGNNVIAAAADVTAVRVSGGTLTTVGEEWTITSLLLFAGKVIQNHYDSTAVITTGTLYANAILDLIQSYRARTVSTLNMVAGSKVLLDAHITITSLAIAAEAGEIALSKPTA